MSAFGNHGVGPPTKLVYLARRNPDLDREQFIRRWRQHAALAMGLQRWRSIGRYAQCDIQPPLAGLPDARGDYDGIGIIWFHDSVPISPEDRVTMRADELETFSTYVDQFALVVAESVLKEGTGPIKANHFVTRRGGRTRSDFIDQWLHDQGLKTASSRRSRSLKRLVMNEVRPSDRGSTLEFDGLAEYWFDTHDDLLAFFSHDGAGPLDNPLIDHARSVLVVSNEVLLYDLLPVSNP